jgi:hypothetical protein
MESTLTEKPISTLEDLGERLGLKPGDATSILAEVRQNHALLKTCTRHQFRATDDPPSINSKHTCLNCGGVMRAEQVGYYAHGVRHSGQPFDVWL